jgi:acetyl esterase
MNRFVKLVLKAFSSPKIDMKEDYPLVRKLQHMFSAKTKKDYMILDRKIYSEDLMRDIPVRIFFPKKMEHRDVLLFFHGGGWVIGDIDTYTNVCINMAELTGRTVYSVDYRLAPEHPYPAGLDDCYRVAEVLLTNIKRFGLGDDSQLMLIGDSAGANLAAAVSLRLRDNGKPLPAKQILLYPVTYWDHSDDSPFESIRTNGYDYGLTAKKVRDYMELYEPDLEIRKSKYISPLMADDLSRQPDTLLITAEFDPLRDEGEAYGELLKKAGNKVEIHRVEEAAHGFIALPRFAKPVSEAYQEINDFLNN